MSLCGYFHFPLKHPESWRPGLDLLFAGKDLAFLLRSKVSLKAFSERRKQRC